MMGGYSPAKLAPYGGRTEPKPNTLRFSVEVEYTSDKDVQEFYLLGPNTESLIRSEIQSNLEGLDYVRSVKVERKF